ncbi:4Fe-4S ferredoxin [Thermosulfidibacter takaii ABI70S6]|uniref:4Fe-4S ferredoxin n=1 Tax=Thermosulfidibacter takaii (strain DSM 17441 / JCM 13301 / NBRC 103674 / ABI70S6) TaxID=1298851 RepID=A0A0S3QRB9_THET7|nr:4Fe-4S binding protein [Thermosulfidibacter takaii]BAT70871.1 4Fe-4S ferredoxin [Thermosulfidibacter takaii ABI70S6]
MQKVLRKIVEIDEELCDGCGLCVQACEEGAIQIINGKAKLVSERMCDGLGVCIGHCPKGAIKIIEREAEPFEEEAIHHHHGMACPGSALKEFKQETDAQEIDIPSALTHWPVQIRLVPPTASFLKGAHLLVVADCVPAAYPELHTKLLPGKKILIGCPKFDPKEEYTKRFKDIMVAAKPSKISVVVMEVPCCQGLIRIILKARELAQMDTPLEVIVVGVQGEILHKEVI